MNFDDIKSAWGKAPESNITVPKTIEDLKKAELPVDKIKQNMRYEFVVQSLAVILIAFVPQIYKLQPVLLVPFNVVYMLFAITCIYFFARFYAFYKRIGNASLTTKDALYEVNYDIRLHIELYKMFSYMLFPFVLMMVGIILANTKYDKIVQLLQSGITYNMFYLYFGLVVIAIYALLHFATVYWLRTYYSKYANEIARILSDLKEE